MWGSPALLLNVIKRRTGLVLAKKSLAAARKGTEPFALTEAYVKLRQLIMNSVKAPASKLNQDKA